MARDGEIIQRQHFLSSRRHNLPSKSGYIMTKLHGTSTCGCHFNPMFSELFSRFLPPSYAGHVNLAGEKP